MDLTGVIADIYMCEWDKKMMQIMNDKGYEYKMYKRYKDDINVIFSKEGSGNPTTKEITDELKMMADSVDGNLTVKTDVTENYEDKKLPILDVKVWIGKDKNNETKILYNHFMKSVSSKKVIQENSAHGERMRENVLVNDVCRVMRNCSENLEWDNGKKESLDMYMGRLQFSGYNENERYKILKKACDKYDNVRVGNRRIGLRKKKKNWYMKDGVSETVMFVNATPNEILKKKVEKIAKKYKLKVKVVERRGRTVKSMLQKSDPFKKLECSETDCVICREGMDIDCRRRGIVYEIECKEEGCNKKYIGQTGRSIYERIKEHNTYNEKDREDDNKPLAKHSFDEHEGKKVKFNVKLKGNTYGKPSRRMLTEAVYIDDMMTFESMNEKKGWSHVII